MRTLAEVTEDKWNGTSMTVSTFWPTKRPSSLRLMEKVDAQNNKGGAVQRVAQESEVDLQLGCRTEHVDF